MSSVNSASFISGAGGGGKGDGVAFVALFCEYGRHVVEGVGRMPGTGSENKN